MIPPWLDALLYYVLVPYAFIGVLHAVYAVAVGWHDPVMVSYRRESWAGFMLATLVAFTWFTLTWPGALWWGKDEDWHQ